MVIFGLVLGVLWGLVRIRLGWLSGLLIVTDSQGLLEIEGLRFGFGMIERLFGGDRV